jgi:MoxR-like ATPase
LFARGHLLIEDVPGVAKTTLAKAIARSIEGGCVRRIQFTPDILPTDVTGVQVFDQNRRRFEFHPGPVFANILIGDEINRASPKSQSALLEVMAERRVTVDGETHHVPRPFLCIATQNPIDQYGTFPLPEAQIDRFMIRTGIGYPSPADEAAVIADVVGGSTAEALEPVLHLDLARSMMDVVERVRVVPDICRYIVSLATATRGGEGLNLGIQLGVSPRGCIALAAAGQVLAASEGREFVSPDDVKALAVPVFAHRLLLLPGAGPEPDATRQADLVRQVLAATPVRRGRAL